MEPEDKGKSVKETIADEAKGVAVEVYKDVGKPVLAPVGNVAGGLVNLVLWPVKLALDSANAKLGKLSARVEQKLKAVPPERQLAAPATVAGPAALQYALLGDGDDVAELRDMFENLLARSMDIETASSVHPAFVGLISQMAPDEARILKSITQSEYAATYVQDRADKSRNGVSLGFRTLLGRGIGIEESRISEYISNLDRLGILRIEIRSRTPDFLAYETLQRLAEAEFPAPGPYPPRVILTDCTIGVTTLGARFLATCVNVHVPAARYG